ncbi:MAG: hypothetical protein KA757_02500, partial [Vogesella sp.]|nr:hypothetical protein [Vogesella sp.]
MMLSSLAALYGRRTGASPPRQPPVPAKTKFILLNQLFAQNLCFVILSSVLITGLQAAARNKARLP